MILPHFLVKQSYFLKHDELFLNSCTTHEIQTEISMCIYSIDRKV